VCVRLCVCVYVCAIVAICVWEYGAVHANAIVNSLFA